MGRKPYDAPCIVAQKYLRFETNVSLQYCDDNGDGDDKDGKDPDAGIGYCQTSNPKD